MPSDLALLIIELIALLVGLISAWILGIRMQRRIRRALRRKVEDTDLTSLRAWMAVEEAEKKSDRVKPIQASDKNTISLQWAGLPIEYWIDINILEWSPVSETLGELCGKFPGQSREHHISLITKRLTYLALINEIGFQLETGAVRTNLFLLGAQLLLVTLLVLVAHSQGLCSKPRPVVFRTVGDCVGLR
jgi:hypothetical protein